MGYNSLAVIVVLALAVVILTGCAIGPRAEANVHVFSPHDNSVTAGSHNNEAAKDDAIPGAVWIAAAAFAFIAVGTWRGGSA